MSSAIIDDIGNETQEVHVIDIVKDLKSQLKVEQEKKPVEVSKYSVRQEIWTSFDKNGLVTFPRPVRGRVPNFKGSIEAAEKLKESEFFQKANVVKVNVDKPQELVRFHTLEAKKRLLVSARRWETFALLEVQPEDEVTPASLKTAATRLGLRNSGKPVAADAVGKIDLLVIGSVAVTRTGRRIGKCDGYSDLEFGYLTEIGAITNDTVIATTVHDSQVLDSLPDDLFREHDIPVDVIVTPTQIIEVQPRGQRPPGIVWPLLSKRRMELCPNISALHKSYVENGKDCHLKPEDTDEETEREIRRKHRPFIYRFSLRRKPNSRKTQDGNKDGADEVNGESGKADHGPRPRRRRSERKTTENGSNVDAKSDDKTKKDSKKRFAPRGRPWRPLPILFSLRIGGIASTDRIRDLKKALAARNVKPAEINWYGRRGFAFVHFARPRKQTMTPIELETVVASLKDMKLGEVEGQEKAPVIVEPAVRPRVESPTAAAL